MFAVEMQNITKSFGERVLANKSVDFRVRRGEIHALVGENGAGKSTLMKILYGMYRADSGKIKVNGNEETISSPARAIQLHIGMVHQHFMLVNPLTVLENIILGNEPTGFLGHLNTITSRIKINELLKSYRISIDPEAKIRDLSVGLQQRVEILKILYRDAEILILDEPTAVLTPQEIDDLFITLNDLKSKGKTIILITHKLNEVMDISDSVTVMRQGKIAGELVTEQTTGEEISRLMVGYDFEESYVKDTKPEKKVVLEVADLSVLNEQNIETVKHISFKIYAGEILGIAGVEGNGQNELVEAITSLRKPVSGSIKVNGENLHEEISIAHIPADRQKNGMVLDFSIPENVILGREKEKEFSTPLKLNKKYIGIYTISLIKEYDIRLESIKQKIKELSGGNQQKVIAARELGKNTDLLVVNHPSRGLDIKATAFVHDVLLQERKKGKAILLISSDLSELVKLSDRIAVILNGKITTVLDTAKTDEREIGLYMTGAKNTIN
jgi:general nucleoside transport system ATP-binding protein